MTYTDMHRRISARAGALQSVAPDVVWSAWASRLRRRWPREEANESHVSWTWPRSASDVDGPRDRGPRGRCVDSRARCGRGREPGVGFDREAVSACLTTTPVVASHFPAEANRFGGGFSFKCAALTTERLSWPAHSAVRARCSEPQVIMDACQMVAIRSTERPKRGCAPLVAVLFSRIIHGSTVRSVIRSSSRTNGSAGRLAASVGPSGRVAVY